MVKRMQREIPTGEIQESVEAAGDAFEVFQINRQVDKDAKEFKLTPGEIRELRDAYALESSMGAAVHNFRYFNNKFRNGKTLRSSQEILEAAGQRNQQQVQDNPSAEEQTPEDDSTQLPDIHTGPSSDPDPTTVPLSVPGSMEQVLGQIGETISTAGHATFDMAVGLGQETLNQLMQVASMAGAGGKGLTTMLVQLATGNALASMQQAMLAHVASNVPPGQMVIHGFGGDIVIRKSTEDAMNTPQNQGVFSQMADMLMEVLGLGSNPAESMVGAIMARLRNGEIRMPGHMLLPDIHGWEHVPGSGQNILVFGIPIPVAYPREVVLQDTPQLPGTWNEAPMYRRADGAVVVKAHNRGGHPVREYTRSAPDGDVTNNLSYRTR